MRIIKLSPDESKHFENRESVISFFTEDLFSREEKGKFRIPKGALDEKKFKKGEKLFFSYNKEILFAAVSISEKLPNNDKHKKELPFYFTVDTDTLKPISGLTLDDLEKKIRKIIPGKNIVQSEGWPYLEDNEKTDKLWNEIVSEEKKNYGNEKRIARIAFNTNGWILPSGKYGKSKSSSTHEFKYGYGHEEWLFDYGKIIDGYKYGFLEPIRKQQKAYTGNKYDVWLYTIDSKTGKRYWVGEIKNLEVIENKESESIKSIYNKNGWLKEMEEQIQNSGGNKRGFSKWKGVDLFNVRFKVEEAKINEPTIELPESHSIYKQTRYVFGMFNSKMKIEDDSFSFNISNNDESIDDANKKIRTQTERTVEISEIHKKISKGLYKKLVEINGKNNVSTENPAGYCGNKIDLVVQEKKRSEYVFYEIKACNTLRTCIREAFGQLLEYAYWKNEENKKIKELIIVTQPFSEELGQVKEYLKRLREMFEIPIYYQSFNYKTGMLSEKY